ncbi:MAG: flagellar basal body L-ring protein FlgH [Ignavibacteriaceae bacterium]|jgi:flagellar L-ring protein precursor FlgH
MKKFYMLVFLIGTLNLYAQDMRQNAFSSLFSDQKASKVGDAITIVVLESSQASNNAQTTTGRSSNVGLTGTIDPGKGVSTNPNIALGTTNNFSGTGSTQTQGVVSTTISATVDSVLANGNLVIGGSRKITINGEQQTVNIKGIVRSADISPDNSVFSYNISEAQIVFKGDGKINDSQSPGWLTKFLHWIF